MNILDAIGDDAVFRPWFERGGGESWAAWRAFLAALFALEMSPEEQAIYRACTGRTALPEVPFPEAALICGRRAGKSFVLALLATFLATFRDWRPYLQRGERATIIVVAADKRQARTIFRYLTGLIEGVPMLDGLVERRTSEAIDLHRNVSVEVMTASFRSLRGYAVPCALLDELAFWPFDEGSASPDSAVLEAIRPAMAQFPDPMLLMASSPYSRRGELWRMFKTHHGRDDAPALTWKAATRVMNPTISERVVAEALERDEVSARSEYLAEFRSDLEMLLSREAVEACVDPGIRERPPMSGVDYFAFCDPAGGGAGGGADSMCLAIGHREGETAVLDVLREARPPFSPAAIVREFSELLKSYRVRSVTGDRWGGEFVREPMRKAGCEYRLAPVPTSDLYRDFVPALNSGRVALLDHARLQAQLIGLERRVGRSGRDQIGHSPGAHDDLATVCAGVTVMLLSRAKPEPRLGLAAPQIRRPLTRNYGSYHA